MSAPAGSRLPGRRARGAACRAAGRAGVRGLGRTLRGQPVSLAIALLLVLVAVVSGSTDGGPRDDLRRAVGAGLDGRSSFHAWSATLASVLFAGSLAELVVTILVVLVLVGVSERLLGWRLTITAYIVTGALATATGIGVQAVGLAVGESWSLQVAYDSTLHPFTPALGTIFAASAFAGSLWRRRIRLLGFAAITTFLLYDGHPAGLYALAGAVAGLMLGGVLRRGSRPVEQHWLRSTHHEARVLLSVLVSMTALGPVVTLLSRAPIGLLAPLGELYRDILPERPLSSGCRLALHHQEPGTSHLPSMAGTCARAAGLDSLHGPGTVLLSILPLVLLLISASSIRRGRRVAAWAAIVVNVTLALLVALYQGVLPLAADDSPVVPGHQIERGFLSALAVVVPLAVSAAIGVRLHHFTVRPPQRVVRRYLVRLVASFTVLAGSFAITAWLARGRFTPGFELADLPAVTLQRFVPIGFVGAARIGPVPIDLPVRVLFEAVGPAFWLLATVGLIQAAHDSSQARAGGPRGALRRILRRGVPGSLSHMATWEGNDYWFGPDGETAVAYRAIGRHAVTTGGPLCSPERAAETVVGFARWCDDQGLSPVFYSAGSELVGVFESLGWSTLPVGEETLLDPGAFSMSGKKWQDVRTSINRAAKDDIRAVSTRYVDLRPSIAVQIEEISELWVAEKRLPELGFTLGAFDELVDPDVELMLALDADDRVLAVTSWLPTWRDGEVVGRTLDFMRRHPDTRGGVMEFVIAETVLRARSRGIEFVSLSAAPLAGIDSETDSDASSQTRRVLRFVADALEPAYGFRSLLAFKRKFQPTLHGLVMAYPDPIDLPAIGTVLARAYLPELSVRQLPQIIRSVV